MTASENVRSGEGGAQLQFQVCAPPGGTIQSQNLGVPLCSSVLSRSRPAICEGPLICLQRALAKEPSIKPRELEGKVAGGVGFKKGKRGGPLYQL